METFILRIYQRKSHSQEIFTGTLENAGTQKTYPVHNASELVDLLDDQSKHTCSVDTDNGTSPNLISQTDGCTLGSNGRGNVVKIINRNQGWKPNRHGR
jgi:hypothetical protein